MQENPYLDEVFSNLDSPQAILELWDLAVEEYNNTPDKDASLNWIVAFDELYKWNMASEKANVKMYYSQLDPKNAYITLKFLEILEFFELIPHFYKGINNTENAIFEEIDTWIDQNDLIIDGVFLNIVMAQKEWFYKIINRK